MDSCEVERHWQECFDRWGIGGNREAEASAREILCASVSLFLSCGGNGSCLDLLTVPVSAMESMIVKMADVSKQLVPTEGERK